MKIVNLQIRTLLWVEYRSEAKEIAKFLKENDIFAVVPDENHHKQELKHRTVQVFRPYLNDALKLAKKYAKKNNINILKDFNEFNENEIGNVTIL